MRLTRLTTVLVSLMLLLSACSTVKLDEAPSVETRKPTALSSADANSANSASVPSSSDASLSGSDVTSRATADSNTGANSNAGSNSNASANANDPLSDPSSILAKRSIYFDLDSYVVKDEYKSVIDAHGKYLASVQTARF